MPFLPFFAAFRAAGTTPPCRYADFHDAAVMITAAADDASARVALCRRYQI